MTRDDRCDALLFGFFIAANVVLICVAPLPWALANVFSAAAIGWLWGALWQWRRGMR